MFDQIDLTWWIEGVTISGVSIIGLIGNFYSLKIYARQKDHRVFHHLLLQLALFDIVSFFLISRNFWTLGSFKVTENCEVL